MINEIHIQNYRSIVNAQVKLSPFTLLIGANGTGKTNFLRLIKELNASNTKVVSVSPFTIVEIKNKLPTHINFQNTPQSILYRVDNSFKDSKKFFNQNTPMLFNLTPANIGRAEPLTPTPTVQESGIGAVAVLDALKTGDREDLFNEIEAKLREYIPEIEKLSFIPGQSTKQLQVREKNINQPVLVSDLSEGTQLVLTILTIVHQINPPNIICLEEIDRGLHPRLFQRIIELFFRMTREKNIQIIATTHNPYLVDQFKGHEEAVIIVEKEKGETKFTSLAERLVGLDPLEDDPLGTLWYSGLVGGVPQRG